MSKELEDKLDQVEAMNISMPILADRITKAEGNMGGIYHRMLDMEEYMKKHKFKVSTQDGCRAASKGQYHQRSFICLRTIEKTFAEARLRGAGKKENTR